MPAVMKLMSLKPRKPTREELEAIARRHAAENRSDPFAYSRCLSHLLSGVAEPKDYDTGGRP